jgi:hypothetical protein
MKILGNSACEVCNMGYFHLDERPFRKLAHHLYSCMTQGP